MWKSKASKSNYEAESKQTLQNFTGLSRTLHPRGQNFSQPPLRDPLFCSSHVQDSDFETDLTYSNLRAFFCISRRYRIVNYLSAMLKKATKNISQDCQFLSSVIGFQEGVWPLSNRLGNPYAANVSLIL
jgi:hypothetical protein